jgi:hypothetical protein
MTISEEQAAIGVKEAVRIAQQYMDDLYGEAHLPNVILEEVEFSDDEEFLLITFGFDRPAFPKTIFEGALTGSRLERGYKVVSVRRRDGVVRSVKMRPMP